MARVSRVLPHLSISEVQEKIRTAQSFRTQQRWLIIYNALVDPRQATEIALHTGTTVRTVHQVISDYNRLGAAAIETPGKGGRRKSYFSSEEETAFLAKLSALAEKGEITTRAEVKVAWERQLGHQVHRSTIYRLLKRHQWHKIKPRPRHPKADPEEQAEFKASFARVVQQICQLRVPSDNRPVLVMASDEGRFGRTGEVHPCWCPPGIRPTVQRQQVRQYVYTYWFVNL
jgi:transposase